MYTCCIEDSTITFLVVLPYDPDSKITKKSLYGLEAIGIPIISALENKFTQLQSATGLRLKNSDLVGHCTSNWLEIFVDKWVEIKQPTWRQFNHTLRKLMDLRNLSEEILYCLKGEQRPACMHYCLNDCLFVTNIVNPQRACAEGYSSQLCLCVCICLMHPTLVRHLLK